ncbi:MAG: RNA polymerase sigma factor [Alphaproteobacteria bacterium]|nr:RNA polymerase sigma factor [Alphaproteobacteria bacterium]
MSVEVYVEYESPIALETCDSDYELLQRVAQGDMRAYRKLVDRHLTRGVKVAERMLGNRQDAEDVMQEVCLKIWKEAPRWQPRAKFTTWLYRVILNACLDRKRRAAPLMSEELDEIPDTQPMAEERLIDFQRSEAVKQGLLQLPDRQRAAIILSYYEEMSNQGASDSMGVALGAFQQLLFRAKQNLKIYLGEIENPGGMKNGTGT